MILRDTRILDRIDHTVLYTYIKVESILKKKLVSCLFRNLLLDFYSKLKINFHYNIIKQLDMSYPEMWVYFFFDTDSTGFCKTKEDLVRRALAPLGNLINSKIRFLKPREHEQVRLLTHISVGITQYFKSNPDLVSTHHYKCLRKKDTRSRETRDNDVSILHIVPFLHALLTVFGSKVVISQIPRAHLHSPVIYEMVSLANTQWAKNLKKSAKIHGKPNNDFFLL